MYGSREREQALKGVENFKRRELLSPAQKV